MDWVVFGDDFGAHPSTTQHLVAHLPPGDRVVWVSSIGMRSPRPTLTDIWRVGGRLRTFAERLFGGAQDAPARATGPRIQIVVPQVAPWHGARAAVALNRLSLRRSIRSALDVLGVKGPVAVLAANPIAVEYIESLTIERLGYLRLDDYPRLPGVDAGVVGPLERKLIARADVLVATARSLLPHTTRAGLRLLYLPQGVDTAHFGAFPPEVPAGRVLGFFGLLAEWLDYGLVIDVARENPAWTLELVGPVRRIPRALQMVRNIRLLPKVPYEGLPRAIRGWAAAWAPFGESELTRSVNPLKLREYLAAGLPVATTPIPEALALGDAVVIVRSSRDVGAWLEGPVARDTPQERTRRREAVAGDGWSARAADLRAAMLGGGS